ncbi:MAG: hypothetical protein JST36_01275 [Bacteroidetes bacterium]|nr:hypothetical protein [Bacteroidota bacterium]
MYRYLYLVTFLLLQLFSTPALAQADADWRYKSSFNFGGNLYFFSGQGQKFPGWKIFVGVGVSAINKHNFLFNYGPTVAVYSKSLGANLNPLSNDVQVDFSNSFTAGAWWGDPYYNKFFRTIGNSAAYNFYTDVRNAVLLSTIFIFNNHKRNQALGALTGSFGDFTINYYNDGGAPIEWLTVSDHFDRYWTGGLGLFFHNNDQFNSVEFLFDQFTGYKPMLYEMSSLLGIRVPDYNLNELGASGNFPDNFNTSAYNLRIMPYRNFGFDLGMIGSLRTKKGIPFGLQDIIHTLGNYALHPNNDANRFFLGGTYQNNRDAGL